jgi:hypothetical protein
MLHSLEHDNDVICPILPLTSCYLDAHHGRVRLKNLSEKLSSPLAFIEMEKAFTVN